MEEEDHSTPSSHTLLHMAAAPLSLFFSSLHSHTLSLIFLSNISLLYRHFMVNMEGPIALKHGMNCGTIYASICLVVGYCHKWQYPNNHPLPFVWAIILLLLLHKLVFCSSFKFTILRASSTQHSPSSVSIMLSPEWFFKPYTKAYNTPLKRIFPSATVIEYFNVITSSPLFQESTHPGVTPALCSTLGTTPYFSVSLSLLVVRVQVALHL